MSEAATTRRVRELSEWPPPHLSDGEAATLAVGPRRHVSTAKCPECGADMHGYSCPFCSDYDSGWSE